MDWYKHHLSDYMQATRHLTMLQDGAYRRLLDVYYQQEGPITVEERVVFRLCNALHHREKEAVRYVLGKFFIPLEGFYRNTRADEEIEQYQRQRDANRRPNRIPNGSPNGSPNRPLDKRDREKERETCGYLLENGEKCGQIVTSKLLGQPLCTTHNPYLKNK